MVDKKWTYLFHWTQSLDKHTKQLITPNFHDQYKSLCYDYKKAMSLEETDLRYVVIRSWWYSFGTTSEGAIQEFNNGFGF
jgi:hypothetical protein